MDVSDFLKEHATYHAIVMSVCAGSEAVYVSVCVSDFNAFICLSKLGWTDT